MSDFLTRLPEFDGRMDDIRDAAAKEGKVVRYVGSIDMRGGGGGALKVGLESFDRGHPIAGLEGSDNIVSFYTERYGDSPLVVRGAG